MGSRHRAALEEFVAPARRRPQIWRICLGVLLCVAVYLLGLNVMAGFLARRGIPISALAQGDSPLGMLLLLASFGWMLLGPVLAVQVLHARSAATLFGRAPVLIRDFAITAGCIASVQALSLFGWFLVYDAVPNLPLALWLPLLPFSLAGIALQTAAEEAVFRGYLLQQLAARFRSPLIWALLPSALFGMLHHQPGLGAADWTMMGAMLVIGLLAADMTARTGNLGAAWGMHFANNSAALLVLASDGALPGLALFRTPYPADAIGWLIVGDVIVLLFGWAAARRILRR